MKRKIHIWLSLFLFASLLTVDADEKKVSKNKPLNAVLFVGGCCHDYPTLAPHLTNGIGQIIKINFNVQTNMDLLKNKNFADGYDVIIYDFCFDEADSVLLENALQTTREGKPAVMIHCAVHAFRKSEKVREWENCCGMRSKVHDAYQSFATQKLDKENPITKSFPDDWKTTGDELYQTIELLAESKPLLKAKSPQDGREHTVCWIHNYGRGRVFGTTLGHDMKTAETAEYIRLVANGILWACDRPIQK